jgi:hypothetical protein
MNMEMKWINESRSWIKAWVNELNEINESIIKFKHELWVWYEIDKSLI